MIENKHPEILLELLPLTINADPREIVRRYCLFLSFHYPVWSVEMKVKETSPVPYNLTLLLTYVLYPEKSDLRTSK